MFTESNNSMAFLYKTEQLSLQGISIHFIIEVAFFFLWQILHIGNYNEVHLFDLVIMHHLDVSRVLAEEAERLRK